MDKVLLHDKKVQNKTQLQQLQQLLAHIHSESLIRNTTRNLLLDKM